MTLACEMRPFHSGLREVSAVVVRVVLGFLLTQPPCTYAIPFPYPRRRGGRSVAEAPSSIVSSPKETPKETRGRTRGKRRCTLRLLRKMAAAAIPAAHAVSCGRG